ncbi:putative ankyrin repeat protein [Lachnellula subtilissima]|uniref:Putative ankyrin repeat protein n=1 Tax=Lachnellula subtilissima TaxID=602034 RepID=A0A8H8REZ0_9HELO|nr:putative ankyrin repeat protein [Lachnellula subtilissima]
MQSENQASVEEHPANTRQQILTPHEIALEKFWAACEIGDLIQFTNQLKESFGELSDANVKILLKRMVKKGWLEGMRCLLDQGADPTLLTASILVQECRSAAMLQLLADFGVDYKSGDSNILSSVSGPPASRREILDWLLDHGLDINGPTNDTVQGTDRSYRDNTVEVLNAAAAQGDIDLFDHLVSRGARPHHSNALHNAARSKNAVAMITHLIETYHLDVNASDACNGLNELDLVGFKGTPKYALNYALTACNTPAAEVLLKYGARIGQALSYAISSQKTSAVKLILDAGADPSDGLCNAIVSDYLEAAQLCLEHGGDIAAGEARDKFVAGFGGSYTGMSNEMRKLLDEWKNKQQDSPKV